jgi:hypothetical protein
MGSVLRPTGELAKVLVDQQVSYKKSRKVWYRFLITVQF